MTTPLTFERLSRSAQRAFGVIENAVRENIPSRLVQQMLRELEIPVRRQDLLEAMRYARGEQVKSYAIKNVGADRLPNPERLGYSHTYMSHNYAYVVEIRTNLVEDGKPVVKYVTVSTDELITPRAAVTRAEEYVREETERYGLTTPQYEVTEYVVVSAVRRYEGT